MALLTQSYPADLEATLLQLGLATSTSSFSAAGALDGEELLPIELLECGMTPAGALDHEELLDVELLECGTTPAGALDHEELLHVELDPRGVFSNRQELRIECWKVQFRYFRNELFWQELDIVLVGLWSSTRFHNKSICASSWTVKENDISKDRWPVSQPKFLRRPSSWHDHIVSDGEDEAIHLRLDDVDSRAVQAL